MSSYEQCFNIVTKILFVYPHQRVQFQFLICQLSVTYSLVFHSSLNLCVFCVTSPRVRPLVLCWHLLAPPGITPQALLAQHMCEGRGHREGWETLTWGHSWGSWGHFGAPPLLARWKLGILGRRWRGFHSSLAPLETQTGITEMSGMVSTCCFQFF